MHGSGLGCGGEGGVGQALVGVRGRGRRFVRCFWGYPLVLLGELCQCVLTGSPKTADLPRFWSIDLARTTWWNGLSEAEIESVTGEGG